MIFQILWPTTHALGRVQAWLAKGFREGTVLEHDLDVLAEQPLEVVARLERHALHILGWYVFSQPRRLISSLTIL